MVSRSHWADCGRGLIVEPVGPAAIRGANVRRYAAVLDRLIREGVERQLAGTAKHGAALILGLSSADFHAETISVSEVQISQPFNPPGANVRMTLSPGAITGVLVPPPIGPRDPG